jgi:hypothetical protein
MSGGLLGVLFMIPLRPYLIVREHANLPYPEGTACAEVLKAAESGGSRAHNVFLGPGIGALFKGITGSQRRILGLFQRRGLLDEQNRNDMLTWRAPAASASTPPSASTAPTERAGSAPRYWRPASFAVDRLRIERSRKHCPCAVILNRKSALDPDPARCLSNRQPVHRAAAPRAAGRTAPRRRKPEVSR